MLPPNPPFWIVSLRKTRATIPAAPASGARSAAGRPAGTTYGRVAAGMSGTHSRREACAQRACISGVRLNVSRVRAGRCIPTGTQTDARPVSEVIRAAIEEHINSRKKRSCLGKFERERSGGNNSALHRGRNVAQVYVAVDQLTPRVCDTDDRPVLVPANLGKESPELLCHFPVVVPNHVRVAPLCARFAGVTGLLKKNLRGS
jgi:hypothetical protein